MPKITILKTSFSLIFLAIFCYWIFTALSPSQVQNQKIANNDNFDKKISGIAKAIDGDSVIVSGKEIRLFGIDAPEFSQICLDKNNNPYSCGKVAKQFTINLVNNKNLDCFYQNKDIYNRFLAKCYLGKLDINKEILANGMAIIYSYKASSQDMIDAEELAKTKKIGIWQGPFQRPKDYRKSNKRNKQ